MSNSKIKLVSLLKERSIIEEGVVKNSKAFNIMAYQIIEHISKSSRLKDGVVEDYVNAVCSSKDSSITSLLISDFRSSHSSNIGFYLSSMIDDGEVLGGNPTPDFEEFLDFLDDSDFKLILDFHSTDMKTQGEYEDERSWDTDELITGSIILNLFSVTPVYHINKRTDVCKPTSNYREVFYDILKRSFVENNKYSLTLQHELQHAYDDWRSKGKYKDTPEQKSYDTLITDESSLSPDVKEDIYDLYLQLPHEIWARVQEQVQRIRFQVSDDIILHIFKDQESRHSRASKFINLIFRDISSPSFKPSDQLKRRLLKVFSQLINLRYEDIKNKSK